MRRKAEVPKALNEKGVNIIFAQNAVQLALRNQLGNLPYLQMKTGSLKFYAPALQACSCDGRSVSFYHLSKCRNFARWLQTKVETPSGRMLLNTGLVSFRRNSHSATGDLNRVAVHSSLGHDLYFMKS